MVETLARNWWAVALRGAAAIIFGILALAWPRETLTVIIYLFGAYALVDGIFSGVAAIVRAAERRTDWWPLLLEAVIGIIIGVVTFFHPGFTALVLVYVIAAWALLTGIAELVAAWQLRQSIQGEWVLALAGILSILAAIVLAVNPRTGALAVIWVIGLYAIFFGVLLLGLAWRLREHNKHVEARHRGATSPAG